MACASASTAPLFQNKLKHTLCISSRKQRYGMHMFETSFRKSDQIIHDFYNSKCELMTRRWVLYAASEVPLSLTELIGERCEPNNNSNESNLIAEDSASSNTSFYSLERNLGKPGFISFQGISYRRGEGQVLESASNTEISKLLWFIGPIALVTFLVFPSLYLRRILSTMCEDSLLTDFLILFFTESLFYGGVAIFLCIVDRIWRPLLQSEPRNKMYSNFEYGIKIPSIATLVLTLIIPLVTMGMVWPWTGPAASATLAPYLVGLFVQFAFERYACFRKSPSWPVIPIIFQVYRLHQLNRAAQLVTALSFSLRGAETTSQTLAIKSSLGTLLAVLQILGVICIWSLSSFLMRIIPSSQIIP